jgi:arsenate reductase (thioredoxin)
MARLRKVLFVCVGNSCRSQMAEALARHHAADIIEAKSAGLSPLGRIMEDTLATLQARGISTEGLHSKGLRDTRPFEPELIVNMTGVPGQKLFRHGIVIDWPVRDPYGADLETHRLICDDIEARVTALAEWLRKEASALAR